MGNWRDWLKQNSKKAMVGSIALIVAGLALFNVLEQVGAFVFLFGVIGVVVTVRVTRPPKPAAEPGQTTSQQSGKAAAAIKSSPVLLKDGEVVLLSEYAVRYITKNRKIGMTAGFGGVSVPVGKGVRARVGGVKGQSVFADITEKYHGELVLTNKRIVFVAAQRGFEFTLGRISVITNGDENTTIISTAQETAELHIVPNLNPKEAQKFMAGKMKKIANLSNGAEVLTDRISKAQG